MLKFPIKKETKFLLNYLKKLETLHVGPSFETELGEFFSKMVQLISKPTQLS